MKNFKFNDIVQPVVHDRHIVKSIYTDMMLHGINKNKFSLPKDLTLVMCRSSGDLTNRIIPSLSGYETTSILESNLQYLGISNYTVLYKTLTTKRPRWEWTNKIKLIYDFLESGKCTTKYIMYCDPIDVIFRESPQQIIDIFKQYDCKMLFMSTKNTDGYSCMKSVKKQIDSDVTRGGRYLNAGVFIGYPEFIKLFFKEALTYCTDNDCTDVTWSQYLQSCPPNFPVGGSDQDIFRFLEPKYYPDIKIDYKNKMAYRGS